jgi:hypothetical protein
MGATLKFVSASTLVLLVLFSSHTLVPVASDPTPQPIQASFFGITVSATTTKWPVPVPFGTMGKTAAGGPETGTYWLSLEPSNGTYDWTPLDNLIAAAKSAGISSIIYTLYETPTWASSNQSQSCFATQTFGILGCAAPPKYISDWDAFVTALVTRYKGQIQYYELWNEPNVPSEYSGNISEMVTMAQNAYDIIKSIDSSAQVLAPGVSLAGIAPYTPGCNPGLCWLAEYLQAGGVRYADGVAFHGKTCLSDNSPCLQEGIACTAVEIEACAGSSLLAQINDIRSIMATYGISNKFLVDTEGGYSDEVGQDNLFGSADQQTAFVSRFFILQASENVTIAVYFSWLMNSQTGLLGFGTAAAESETDQGYEQTRSWLLGATFNAPCSLSNGLWTCGITSSSGQKELIAWADTNLSATPYTPPSQYAQYLDLSGVTHQIRPNSSITLDEKPVLLEAASTVTSTNTSNASSSIHSTTKNNATLTTSYSTITAFSNTSSDTTPTLLSSSTTTASSGISTRLLYGAVAVVAITAVIAGITLSKTRQQPK